MVLTIIYYLYIYNKFQFSNSNKYLNYYINMKKKMKKFSWLEMAQKKSKYFKQQFFSKFIGLQNYRCKIFFERNM